MANELHNLADGVESPVTERAPESVSDAVEEALLQSGLHEAQRLRTTWTLEKRWGDDQSVAPYETLRGEGNLLTMAGAKALWQGFSGGTVAGGNYTGSTGNAAIAVGDAGGGSSTLPNPLPAANVGDIDVAAGATVLGTGISSSTCTAGTVTVTTSAVHGLSATLDIGVPVLIYNPTVTGTGYAAATAGYQGVFTIASVPSTTTFTYSLGNGGVCPTSNLGAQGTVKTGLQMVPSAVATTGTTWTVTVGSTTGLAAGQTVIHTGFSPAGYNGTFIVATVASGTTYTITNSTQPGAVSTAGHATAFNRLRVQPTSAITYAPSGTPNGIQYVAAFSTTQANWTWGAWGLDNSVAGQAFTNLFNHAIVGPAGGSGLGVKTSASSWTLTITCSLA